MIQQNNFIEYRDNIFNGVWDASTEVFPTTSNSEKKNIEQSGFWLVTVAGTINSISYTIGDWVYYDGNGNLSKLSVGGSSTAITDNQIVIGTGTGIEGTSKLTYDGTIGSEVLTTTGRISILGTGGSIFIGENSGLNEDLTDNHNIFIGYEVGKNTTTGYNNNGIGYKALYSNISGAHNTGHGDRSLYSNVDAYYNSGIGYQSLYSNIDGIGNTGLGMNSIYYNESGNYNLAAGYDAGVYYGGSTTNTLTNTSNSIFLGYRVMPNANSESNQIVIGCEAIGNGSNTATIGDDNVTDVYMSEDAGATVRQGGLILGGSAVITSVSTGAADNDKMVTQGYVDDIVVGAPTGLELITEDGHDGWRLIGAIAANYGVIGNGAINLSYSSSTSSVRGATGLRSYAEGFNTIASGYYAHVEGSGAIASGEDSHAEGKETIASHIASHAEGYRVTASGLAAHAGGHGYNNTNSPEASGYASFNHQQVENGQGIKESLGANSAILGGKNNETTVTALRSVVLGGSGQSATAPDTTYTMHADVSTGLILNSSTEMISVSTGTSNNDKMVTQGYVDAIASGLTLKDSCLLATDAALSACTAAGAATGKTLTANAVGILTIDGVATSVNDRVVIKDQATNVDNGIYDVTTEGTGAVAFILTRATDFDNDADVVAGAFTFISSGTVNADQGWVVSTNDPITVDTTGIDFSQFSASGTVTAGVGMTKTGSAINIISTAATLTLTADNTEVTYGTAANTACEGDDSRLTDDRTPTAHKDSHDPNDGSDALDTAAAAEISDVVSAGIGTSHSLSRADHIHEIKHDITDNHIVTIDGSPNDNEFARFTADGLEGLTGAETMAALSATATADFSMKSDDSLKIVHVKDPTADQDVATKKYVDDNTGSTVTPAALSKTDDTNVTLTLGGTPATSLLQATSLTLGWTGSVSIARGGTNSTTALANDKVMVSSLGSIRESATITTAELGLLNGMASVSTGAGDNDKLVTKGYVDDNDDAGANVALSNLSGVAINESLVSDTDNKNALGTVEKAWSDLVLGNESVVTWTSEPNTADVTLTHSADLLTLEGGQLDVIHSTTEANMSAVNVCYGTGSPPATANEGTLFIQYT